MVIKAYNIQLPENLMYLGLHPPKHEKLHASKFFYRINTLHLHIDQYEQIFYPQVQILHRCIVSALWAEPTNISIHNHRKYKRV